MTLAQLFYQNSQKRIYRREFERVFKVKFDDYFDNFLGFDIVRFDEEIICAPDGISTRDHIQTCYGAEAVKLIEVLL